MPGGPRAERFDERVLYEVLGRRVVADQVRQIASEAVALLGVEAFQAGLGSRM